jgi:hypothetical protein
MGTKMTLSARAELTNAVRRRYGVATGAAKRKILDEFIAVTGLSREVCDSRAERRADRQQAADPCTPLAV